MVPWTTALVVLSSAWASSSYPEALQNAAEMPCLPSCIVCHGSTAGGPGTATQDFAGALIARGLTGGGQVDALASALNQLDTDREDTDGDGIPDLEALAAGANPNGGPDLCGADAATGPQFGCASHRGNALPMAFAMAAALMGLLRVRRTQPSAPPPAEGPTDQPHRVDHGAP